MKARFFLSLIAVTAFAMLFDACSKDPGFKGNKKISGSVTHDGTALPGAIVYITFDATSATDKYDYSTLTDASGNYSFEGLAKGDYYLDAEYTDSNNITLATPGYHVKLGSNKGEAVADITLE